MYKFICKHFRRNVENFKFRMMFKYVVSYCMHQVSLAKQEELMPGYVKDWERIVQDISMSFVVCGLMSMVIQWHKDGYRIPVEKMAQTAVAMLSRPLIPNL